jgi:hypothetical protein
VTIKDKKSNIVHSRNVSTSKTDFQFSCDNARLDIVDKYVYLGLVLTEHLNYNITANLYHRLLVEHWVF